MALSPARKYVINARVADAAGNTTVVNSDGLVLYTDGEAVRPEAEYVRTTRRDVAVELRLNGNTLKSVTLEGETLAEGIDYVLSGETLVLKGDRLERFPAGRHELRAAFFPLGLTEAPAAGSDTPAEASVTLTVRKADPGLTLTVSGAGVRPEEVTLKAVFSEGASGTVQYRADGKPLGEPVPAGEALRFRAAGSANTYRFTAEYSGDGNYRSAEADCEFTFRKGTQAELRFENPPAQKTYGDAPFAVNVAGGSGTGAVTWKWRKAPLG